MLMRQDLSEDEGRWRCRRKCSQAYPAARGTVEQMLCAGAMLRRLPRVLGEQGRAPERKLSAHALAPRNQPFCGSLPQKAPFEARRF